MKRRSLLSLGLASLLMPLRARSDGAAFAEVPAEEAKPAGALRRGTETRRETLVPDNWKEQARQKQQGLSSWYGKRFHGKQTASGEAFDMHALTAAHRTLPFQTWVRVTNLANGKEVIVRINDRGPRLHSRIIDLSQGAARALGFSKKGVARVEVEVLAKDELEKLAKK